MYIDVKASINFLAEVWIKVDFICMNWYFAEKYSRKIIAIPVCLVIKCNKKKYAKILTTCDVSEILKVKVSFNIFNKLW